MADLTGKQFTTLKKEIRESTPAVVSEFNRVFDSKFNEKIQALGDVTISDAQKHKVRRTLLYSLFREIDPRTPSNTEHKPGRKRNRGQK